MPHLQRVREAAQRDKRAQFTALLHHVDVAALARAFRRLKRSASAGVDGLTVAIYEQHLGRNLQALCAQVHTGQYRPLPVRRVFIPKSDGGQRPLGVPALEDKIVQGAVAEVLNAIYEVDFLGFSYGFRQKRNPHQALSSLHTALMTQHVNGVLDADIRKCLDSVDHGWLMRMVAHRIADPRVLRLITQWLGAGVMESGEWHETRVGTPQGAGISPLLANIVLHYVLDRWVQRWRRTVAHGRVSIVRYADDFVMGFQTDRDARQMRADRQERLGQFGFQLHEEKTRVIEFGRLPVAECHSAYGLREAHGDREELCDAPATIANLAAAAVRALSKDDSLLMIGLSRGIPARELAIELGISYGAARVRIHRLRERMREVAASHLATLGEGERREVERFFRRAGVVLTPGVCNDVT